MVEKRSGFGFESDPEETDKKEKEDKSDKKKSSGESLLDRFTAKPESEAEEPKEWWQKKTEASAEVDPEEVNQKIKERLDQEIEEVQAELSDAVPGSDEYRAAEASLDLKKAVDEKLEQPDIEFKPMVEAEFERLKAEVMAEQKLALDTEVPEDLGDEISEDEPDDPLVVVPPTSTPPPNTPTRATPPPITPPPAGSPPSPPSPAPTAAWGPPPVPRPAPLNPNYLFRDKIPETEPTPPPKRIAAGGAFLLGYIVGRRGGRKRTEARFEPEVKGLEQKVTQAEHLLEQKDEQIRKIATVAGKTAERPAIINQEWSQELPKPPEVVATPKKPIESQPIYEKSVQTPEKLPGLQLEQPKVEQLTTIDLLQIASTIYVGSESVRHLYETNQIDRGGLAHIVKEGLRGGDVKKAFKRVELGQERQRERAKEFRHDPAVALSSLDAAEKGARVGSLPLSQLVNGSSYATAQASAANLQAAAEKKAQNALLQKQAASKRVVLTVSAAVAIGLGLLLIWFLLNLR